METSQPRVSPLCERMKQYKLTTPPWKDNFRKECLDRLRQNRRRLIDERRKNYANDVVMHEWAKLKQYHENIDDYLTIYEDIQKEMDEEADRIFEEYGRCSNVPDYQCENTCENRMVLCANCGRSHDYSNAELPYEAHDVVSFCECGLSTVDRETKVLEPSLCGREACHRIAVAAAGHAANCCRALYAKVFDSGANDGHQLVLFCQACGMNLVIW